MNKKWFWLAIPALVILLIIWNIQKSSSTVADDILLQPEFGEFIVSVTTTGELQAKNSTEIRGPSKARMARIWNMKITDLVDEGTVVKAGDYVAELDRSELTSNMEETELNLDKLTSQLVQAKLDSTLTLSQARNEITNLGYNLEQMQLQMDQAKFEAPAIQRQAEINLEKAVRSLEQAKENYQTKVQQAIEKIKIVEADLAKEQRQYDLQLEVSTGFKIHAPENGIVIYAKEWNGKKKVVGSTISTWDPVVATLPDLSMMESITYVNEVDIQKIKLNQTVIVTMDANQGKVLHGTVTNVANMGEKQPNSDSKVFEVVVEIDESDSTLLPSMTTANTIIVEKLDSVLYIPLECIFHQDSVSYVYKKSSAGAVKLIIDLGVINDNFAVIKDGLAREDHIYLSAPDNADELNFLPR